MKMFKIAIAIVIMVLSLSAGVFAAGAYDGKGTAAFTDIGANISQAGIGWSVTYTGTSTGFSKGYVTIYKPDGWGDWQDVTPTAANYVMVHGVNCTGVSLTTKTDYAQVYIEKGNYNNTRIYLNFANLNSGAADAGRNTFTVYTAPYGGISSGYMGVAIATQPYITVADTTATPTSTYTSTITQTPTRTHTSTNTATDTASATNTHTATNTATDTGTATDTFTATNTFTNTNTATNTYTVTHTATNTHTSTETSTFTNTHTVTETFTPTTTASHTPQTVNLKGSNGTFTGNAAVSQFGAQMVYQTNISGTPIMTPVPYDGKIKDDLTGNALDLVSTSMGVYHMGSVGMNEVGAYYDTSQVLQQSGVTKTAQDMNLVAMSGTPIISSNYSSPTAGVDTEYTRTALWAMPDVMIYSITKTAQILTDYFENGMGLNTTMTAAGDFNTNIIPSYGTRLIFGAGKSITITPTSGKSVVIDGFVFSDLTGVSVTMYSSISPVAKFSTVGDYIMGYKAPINEPVYLYSSVSTTPDSVGWMRNREE